MGIEAAIIGGSLLGAGGSFLSSKKNEKTQKEIANQNLTFEQQMAERSNPLAIKNINPIELSTFDFAQFDDPSKMFLTNPNVQAPNLTTDYMQPYNLDANVSADLNTVMSRVRRRMDEGIPAEQKALMQRQADESFATGMRSNMQAADAYSQATGFGQGTGGINRRIIDERVMQPIAEAQYQFGSNLVLEDYNQKLQAENQLLELGKYAEAREVQAQRENMAREAARNTITTTLTNFDLDSLSRFNNLVMNQKSLYAQQGQVMAQNYADYSKDMANIANSYYSGLGQVASNIGSGVTQLGMMKIQQDYKMKQIGAMKNNWQIPNQNNYQAYSNNNFDYDKNF